MSEFLSPAITVFYVGIDWATETHYVCVLDDTGRIKSTCPINHTADGFAELIRRLGKLGDRAEVAIGIERPDGRLVDALEAGHPVVPVSPNAIKAWRDGEIIFRGEVRRRRRTGHRRVPVLAPTQEHAQAARTRVSRREGVMRGPAGVGDGSGDRTYLFTEVPPWDATHLISAVARKTRP